MNANERESLSYSRSFAFIRGLTLPAEFSREVLGDQLLVIGLELFDIWSLGALRVQIVRIELVHPAHHLLIPLVHQIAVRALAMPWIERVIADHVLRFH